MGVTRASRLLSAAALFLLLVRGVLLAQGVVRPTPAAHGTQVRDGHFYTVGAYEFQPVDPAIPLYSAGGTAARFFKTYPAYAVAAVHLPEGAYVYGMWVEGCDFNASGGQITAHLYDDFTVDGVQASVELGRAASGFTAAPGCGLYFDEGIGFTVDNYHDTYTILLTTDTDDDSVRFTSVHLAYYLQISPPPATATFNDVPTSDPYFQAVEAFAAAQITSGCGGGNFCPNEVVTRAQLAKFFARALGLHWQP